MVKAILIIFSVCMGISLGSLIGGSISMKSTPNSWRVIGGSDAKEGEFPFIISLRIGSSESHTCGGSLIALDWVVTAAHCVYGNPITYYLVVAGTNHLSSGGEIREVDKIIVHEEYSPNLLKNDIALIKLKTPFEESDLIKTIQPFCVNLDNPLSCILTGWGRTSYPGNIPDSLQTLNMSTIPYDDCAKKMSVVTSYQIYKSQVCALTKVGEGACHGDSGGPLLLKDEDAKPWLVGLVSWGSPCAKGDPDVYTRVASFCDWISQNII